MNSSVFSTQSYKKALFKVNENTFEQTAIDLFNHQYRKVKVYKQFVDCLGVNPNNVNKLENIPFLPIQFFKSHKVFCEGLNEEKIFQSSGTTGDNTSKHYFDDVDFYLENTKQIFESTYGSLEQYTVLALLPSYIERGNSSLTAMCSYFMEASGRGESGFYLNNLDELVHKLEKLVEGHEKVLLIGVTFALLDLAENFNLNLSKSVVVMETGGMKGRREEMTRQNVHHALKKALGVNTIHSEYGMTELNSQIYSKGNGVFSPPNWVKVMCRDINDPLFVKNVKHGPINIIDLANVNSCGFIATDDLGRLGENHTLEIIGRIDNSDIRGCNLLVV